MLVLVSIQFYFEIISAGCVWINSWMDGWMDFSSLQSFSLIFLCWQKYFIRLSSISFSLFCILFECIKGYWQSIFLHNFSHVYCHVLFCQNCHFKNVQLLWKTNNWLIMIQLCLKQDFYIFWLKDMTEWNCLWLWIKNKKNHGCLQFFWLIFTLQADMLSFPPAVLYFSNLSCVKNFELQWIHPSPYFLFLRASPRLLGLWQPNVYGIPLGWASVSHTIAF